MNKVLRKFTVVMAILLAMAGIIFAQSNADAAQYIGEARAKQIAYKHAGATEAGARLLKLGLDYDHGMAKYEIEFIFGDAKYEYDIDAVSGAVRKVEKKLGYGGAANSQYISSQAAENIALKHAGISRSKARFIRSKLDHDDGMVKYEIKFFSGLTKYEYDIDATTGNVVKFEHGDD